MEKILYIDDEPINLMLFKSMFKKKYKVISAKSGEEGLIALENHPEIKNVICDMKMPRMSGLEFITVAKKKNPNINFYILTGFEITEEIEKAIQTKLIKKYFQKPFKMQEIDIEISK